MIECLVEQFTTLEDPRCLSKIEHRLVDILVIAVCAVVAEAETFEDIALYGRCKEAWLRGFLELPGGIPSHDTFRRVFMLIDPDEFERCFLVWVRSAFQSDEHGAAAGPEQVAVDGKVIRRSFDRRRGRSPLRLVSAYATNAGWCWLSVPWTRKAASPRPCRSFWRGCSSTAAWSAWTRSPADVRSPATS